MPSRGAAATVVSLIVCFSCGFCSASSGLCPSVTENAQEDSLLQLRFGDAASQADADDVADATGGLRQMLLIATGDFDSKSWGTPRQRKGIPHDHVGTKAKDFRASKLRKLGEEDQPCPAFGTMLPKSGSTSFAAALGGVHDWDQPALEIAGLKWRTEMSEEEKADFLQKRLANFKKQYGCAADINVGYSTIIKDLCNTFPNATFYDVQRNVYRWINSELIETSDLPSADAQKRHTAALAMQLAEKKFNMPDKDFVQTPVGTATLMAHIWCDHVGDGWAYVKRHCTTVERVLEESDGTVVAQHFEVQHKEGKREATLRRNVETVPLPLENTHAHSTDLLERPDMLAAIKKVLDTDPHCRAAQKALLELPTTLGAKVNVNIEDQLKVIYGLLK